MPTHKYDDEFYEGQRSGSRQSAHVILPIVMDLVGQVRSVLDVGCGVGTWLAEVTRLGVQDIVGLDGAYVDRAKLEVPDGFFVPVDLTTSTDLGRTFDLVMSLEVAEHLPEEAAPEFVQTMARHGDVILFSAAPPGQGGTHHVNERWLSYWLDHFTAYGFQSFDVLRPIIWSAETIEPWYRQNVVLLARGAAAERLHATVADRGLPFMTVTDVVHPGVLADNVNNRVQASLRPMLQRLPGIARAAVVSRIKI